METKRPLVSICIPSYNRPEYLKHELASIISQKGFNLQDFEILIIDDASSADIDSVVLPYLSIYENFTFIKNKKNIGIGPNLLKLLENFSGRYFFFLSDDDELLGGALLRLKSTINKHLDVAVFTSSYKVKDIKTGKVSKVEIFDKSLEIPKDDVKSIVKFYGAIHTFSRICIRRDVIDLAGFARHVKSHHPQLYLIARAALLGKSYYSGRPLIIRSQGTPFEWRNPRDYYMREHIKIIKDLSRINPDFYKEAMMERVSYIPDQFYARLGESLDSGFRYLTSILKIPEIGKSPRLLILLSGELLGNTFSRLLHKLAVKLRLVF